MADLIGSDDKEKSLYLIQIQFLDEQLERYQRGCDDLAQQTKVVTSRYGALEEDRKDIVEYLQRCVAAEEEAGERLAQRLRRRRLVARRHREVLELQHRRQLQEIQDHIGDLDSETTMLAAQIEEVQTELMDEELVEQQSQVESLKRQLVRQEKKHHAAVHRLKSGAETEREKMSEERWSTGDDYIETKSSAVIQEERAQHGQLQEEVQVLLDHSVGLLEDGDELRHQAEVLHLNMDVTKTAIDQVAQRSCTHNKELEQLMEKSQQLKVELKDGSTAHDSMLVENEALRRRLASASQRSRQRAAEVDELRAELQEEGSRRRRLEGVTQEAVVTLSHVLTDSQKTSTTRRKMQKLLEVLETSAAPPAPGSTPEESRRGQEPRTSDPRPARPQTLDLATQPSFLMARYRPGDLGLVPRPTWRPKPATSSRTGGRPTRLPLNRKLKTSSSDPEDSTRSSQQ